VFTASTVHNSDKNLIEDNELYKTEIVNSINYIYIKACNYQGNGISRIKNMFEYTIRLFSVTKKFSKPDIIIATSVHPLACVAGLIISKRYNCKCIIEIADMWPLTLVEMGKLSEKSVITKLMYRLEHWIYKKADKIVFTMEGGKDYLIDKGWGKDINLDKVNYINNGIDLNEFNFNKNYKVYEDKDLDNSDTFKVIYTGSMGMANALNYFVEAAEILKNEDMKDVRFILFGDGYQRQQLEDYVIKNKLENVIFKGKVDKNFIPNILSKGNLNVFTGKNISLYKYGLSLNKMFDYFASGKPTLSNIECGYDILEKNNCGMTVKGGLAETLADGILKFYSMPKEEYKRYCDNALRAAQDFDFKVLTDRLEKVILEV
jgi:glycosyltransferase involved in cell wall biosynthesis